MAGSIEGDTFIGRRAQELRGLLKVRRRVDGLTEGDKGRIRTERIPTFDADQISDGARYSDGLGRYGTDMELDICGGTANTE
jgi:hypothetical protein